MCVPSMEEIVLLLDKLIDYLNVNVILSNIYIRITLLCHDNVLCHDIVLCHAISCYDIVLCHDTNNVLCC